MSTHRPALRTYFLGVTRDLLARGVVRRQRGELIEDVVKREAEAVGREVSADLWEVMSELGLGAVSGLEAAARTKVGDLVGAGFEWLIAPMRRAK